MQADSVLYNGDIHTMDAARPSAQAIAINGNRVLATGNDDEMRALLAPGGKAVDLLGRIVVPGFTDSHLHFMSYGLSLMQIDLAEVDTWNRPWPAWRPAPRQPPRPVARWARLGSLALVRRGFSYAPRPGPSSARASSLVAAQVRPCRLGQHPRPGTGWHHRRNARSTRWRHRP